MRAINAQLMRIKINNLPIAAMLKQVPGLKISFTQHYAAHTADGELEPGVQDPGGEEQDDTSVLLPVGCRLKTEIIKFLIFNVSQSQNILLSIS